MLAQYGTTRKFYYHCSRENIQKLSNKIRDMADEFGGYGMRNITEIITIFDRSNKNELDLITQNHIYQLRDCQNINSNYAKNKILLELDRQYEINNCFI
jgi:hypothetical protein